MKNTSKLLLLSIILLMASCGAIRKSKRIEYLFLEHYIADTANGKMPTTYTIKTDYIPGGTTMNSSGQSRTTGGMYTIDVSLIDPVKKDTISTDVGYAIFDLIKNDKNCQPYYRKFKRQRKFIHINRYGSLAAIGVGIGLVSSINQESKNRTKGEKVQSNTGAILMLGGFTNWIGGGITRILLKRATIMKAAYVSQFGPLPKHLPRMSYKSFQTLKQNTPR